jgi:hypothetical protein
LFVGEYILESVGGFATGGKLSSVRQLWLLWEPPGGTLVDRPKRFDMSRVSIGIPEAVPVGLWQERQALFMTKPPCPLKAA